MKCTHCQAELNPQQRFCGNCGQSVSPPVKHSAPVIGAPAQQAGGSGTAVIVLVCLLLFLCGGGGLVAVVGGGMYLMWETRHEQATEEARAEADLAHAARAEVEAARANAEAQARAVEAQTKAMEKLLNEAVEGLKGPDGLGPILEGGSFDGIPSGLDPAPAEGVPAGFEAPPTTPPTPAP